jgi:hypothetical protein
LNYTKEGERGRELIKDRVWQHTLMAQAFGDQEKPPEQFPYVVSFSKAFDFLDFHALQPD